VIFDKVNKKLAFQAKNENIFIKSFNWMIKKLLHNFGFVTKDIQRSGQPSPPVLWLHYALFSFKSVINLAWEPEKSKDQVYERAFCEERKIDYYNFSWNARRPKDWGEVDRVTEIIDKCKKPVWIHCKGGKDRTGGLVAIWKKEKGYPMGLIFRDFQAYEIPAFTWVQQLFCGSPSNVQN
jgi:protein tyrosine/serine phosphatase